MENSKKLSTLSLEGLTYSLLGTVFVVLMILLEESIDSYQNKDGFIVDYVKKSIGLIPLFISLSLSFILGNLPFRKTTKSNFSKWTFILLISSMSAVVVQKTILIYFHNGTFAAFLDLFSFSQETLGLWWMAKLFILLTPLTILFAHRQYLFDKMKNRNSFN